MHRLITIRFSHFNEKARWALDRFGVSYEEDGYMPGMHAFGVLRVAPRFGVGKGDRVGTPLATPVLLTDDARCVRGSSAIMRYASDRFAPPGGDLFPSPEVEALDKKFSEGLGPHTRRFAYFHAFKDPAILREMADANVGRVQAGLFKRFYPAIQGLMARRLGVTAERAARSLDAALAEVKDVSQRIDGRRYLVGERFTAADLSFAALLAPLLMPSPDEGYGAAFPPVEALPSEFAAVVSEVRSSPAGQFALRMFREERGQRKVPFTN